MNTNIISKIGSMIIIIVISFLINTCKIEAKMLLPEDVVKEFNNIDATKSDNSTKLKGILETSTNKINILKGGNVIMQFGYDNSWLYYKTKVDLSDNDFSESKDITNSVSYMINSIFVLSGYSGGKSTLVESAGNTPFDNKVVSYSHIHQILEKEEKVSVINFLGYAIDKIKKV